MSNQGWLTNKGGGWRAESSMNSKVVLTASQANNLATATYNISVSSLLFGDYTKWCASLMYYPIDILNTAGVTYKLRAGGIDYDCEVSGLIDANAEYGFTLGEFYYPAATTYLEFEPYTKCEVYLPYYGFVTIKVADVEGKYIQFRLYIDYNTGMAQYVIGVSSYSITPPNAPYVIGTDDTNTRILGTFNFQLGVSIPIGSTNFNETVRNTILGVGKTALAIGASFATDLIPSSRSTSTYKTVDTNRNVKTGRQITSGTHTETQNRETYTYGTGERLNTAINTASTVLGNLNFSTQGITSNNGSLNNNLCPSVAVVITKAVPVFNPINSPSFKKLQGLPVGECMLFGSCKGYTKVTDIRLEDEGFSTATHREMAELEQLVYQGVIFDISGNPVATFISPNVNGGVNTLSLNEINGSTFYELSQGNYSPKNTTFGFYTSSSGDVYIANGWNTANSFCGITNDPIAKKDQIPRISTTYAPEIMMTFDVGG